MRLPLAMPTERVRNGECSIDTGKLADMDEVEGDGSELRSTGILSDEVDENLDAVDDLHEAVGIRIVRPLESLLGELSEKASPMAFVGGNCDSDIDVHGCRAR